MSIVNDGASFEEKRAAVVDAVACDGCAFCVDICPAACLEVVENPVRPGHRMVAVDGETCQGCGVCQGTCPKEAISIPGLSTHELRQLVREALKQVATQRMEKR